MSFRYNCDGCSFKTNCHTNILQHQSAVRTGPPLDCPICDLTFCFQRGLARHHNKSHSQQTADTTLPEPDGMLKTFETSKPMTGTKPQRIKLMTEINAPESKPVQSPELQTSQTSELLKTWGAPEKKFQSERTRLRKTLQTSKKLEQSKEKKTESKNTQIFNCDKCSYTSYSPQLLSVHRTQRKPNSPILKCSELHCNFTACFKLGLALHKKRVHPKSVLLSDKKTSNNDHRCDKCSYSSYSPQLLSIHLSQRKNNDSPTLQCPEPNCNFTACFKLGLCNHKKRAHSASVLVSKEIYKDKDGGNCYKCNRCSYSSTSSQLLAIHLTQWRKGRENSAVLTCSELGCDYTACFKQGVMRHKKLAHPLSVLKELEERKNNKAEDSVKESKIVKNKPEKLSCDKCSYSTIFPIFLQNHLKSRKETTPLLNCSEPGCDFKACFRNGMCRHRNQAHPERFPDKTIVRVKGRSRTVFSNQNSQQNLHKCDKCSYSTDNAKSLSIHVEYRKENSRVLHCKERGCRFRACFKLALAKHYKRHHRDKFLEGRKKKLLRCDRCAFLCYRKSTLAKHWSCAHGRGPWNKLGSKRDNTAIMDQRLKFSCPYCDYGDEDREGMLGHVKGHKRAEIVFPCKFCGFKSNYLSVIEQHERRHRKERPLGCELCGKVFGGREKLERHGILHGNKSFLRGNIKI